MKEKIKIQRGWKIVDLKSITDSIQYGYTESSSKEKVGPKFLRITDIQDNKVQWDDVPYCKIDNEIKDKYLLKEGDLLFARTGATVGKSILIKGDIPETVFASYLIRVRVNQEINDKYLSYFFHSPNYWSQITEGQVGIGQPNVNGTKLGQLKISIAPLLEQQAIVAKIEELLSDLENGKQQLQTAQQQLKVYRQSLLKWAFEGKLTKDWREKKKALKNADELLKEIKILREKKFKELNKKLKPITKFQEEELLKLPKLPNNWAWVKIIETVLNTAGDIVDGPFGSNLKNSDYVEGSPVPVISISNIEEGFKKKIRYITNEKFETIKRSAVYPGDIIVAKIGSTYGKTGVYPEWMPIGVIPANLLRVRPSNHYSKKLLIYYLKSAVFKKRLDIIMKSTAQPAYNVRMFKELPIPFMSIEEQQHIVDELESKLTVCDKLEETISQSLKQAETLRQSILKKAFEGKLINCELKITN